MIRLFRQHYIRKAEELEGVWDFRLDGSDKVYRLAVPGCMEQHPDLLKTRGTGTYAREVYVEQDGNIRLEFKGVSHTGDVYWDGEQVAHHYNAFTGFSAVVKNVKKGRHRLEVRTDNTFGEHSALHVPNDYYTYGGITRPVAMEHVADTYISGMHFTPSLEDGAWKGRLEIKIRNLADKPAEISVESFLEREGDGGCPQVFAVAGANWDKVGIDPDSEIVLMAEQVFNGAAAWSHEDPALYRWNTVLSVNGISVDDMIDRVGFREVKVSGKRILLNGEPIFLKGFNRHEDYAVVGCAVPFQLMMQDMDLMTDMGANAVRTCHYPNDERFLDLCDERGIFVWEENHARGFGLERMQNPNFDRQCEDCINEMIESHYNHPSIIIWGILNECASETAEGREKYARQYAQIKALDTSRPTTSATCRHLTDICLDLPEVVSFNMYSGWYQDVPVGETNQKEIDWIRASGGTDKPIIVSEFGAAAIYGYRDRARSKWSEERQADIIRENLEVYMNHPDICGVFVWQFADCRVTEEEWFSTRARSHNNKGIVDEYRRPKMAYDVIREMFRHGRCKGDT